MKQQILERLLDKSPQLAYLPNFDDLGSEEEVSGVLRQLKQDGWVRYRCVPGQGWDDDGDDVDISAIELTPTGRKNAQAPVDRLPMSMNIRLHPLTLTPVKVG